MWETPGPAHNAGEREVDARVYGTEREMDPELESVLVEQEVRGQVELDDPRCPFEDEVDLNVFKQFVGSEDCRSLQPIDRWRIELEMLEHMMARTASS
jgi:hypothetical protein